ncbi:glycosyltransferase, partial [Desulfovibrio sp. OttesenSCG-928-G15]|nr:glycosyltransferase [Desulfovibrio sp. OttesenSCG-928-G15]
HSRLVDALVSTNSRTTQQCAEAFSLPDNRLFTIPGGVDTRRFHADPLARARVRAALGYTDKDCVVGLLGRFDQVKGQKELIEALCALRKRAAPEDFARIRLMLMGFATSVSQDEVQGWLQEAGLADQTVITGKVEDVVGHINAMDLGVIASQGSEAIARAAFEIMACKVPLIGTDVGVMPDLLAPQALAPVGSAEAFTALVGKACMSEDFRAALRTEQALRMPEYTLPAFLYATMQAYGCALERMAGR